MDEKVDDVIEQFANITTDDLDQQRKKCERCLRPVTACFCHSLPEKPLEIRTNLFILQHPYEQKRCLRTATILELGLANDRCHILRGRKFSAQTALYASQKTIKLLKDKSKDHHKDNGEKNGDHNGDLQVPDKDKYKKLAQALKEADNTLLLFPTSNAIPLHEMTLDPEIAYNLLVIDGTWAQARGIYRSSPELMQLKKVVVASGVPSKYTIRTQPTEECLSTVEVAGIALSLLEQDPTIYDKLTLPLQTLCEYQIQHGAVKHHSKEYLIVNGLYDKPVTEKIRRKLRRKQDIKSTLLNTE